VEGFGLSQDWTPLDDRNHLAQASLDWVALSTDLDDAPVLHPLDGFHLLKVYE